MEKLAFLGVWVGVAALVAAAEGPREPLCISGIYPSLAALSQAKTECGIGAVVPWAGSLWFITYPAHYGDGKLYQVTPELKLVQRPESNGGTHAGRLIHRESNQLIIGSYVIDAAGKVRPYDIQARVTAVMRHLTDPKNKVYVFDMEGAFFELDVHTLAVTKLGVLQKLGVTGTHGKGGYTGQGRVVVSNNGRGGALAEWDGKAEKWTLVQHDKFTEVTGPGGIQGAADDQSRDIPLWATGWDVRSLMLKVLYAGAWHTYRFPKSTYTHEPDHGWFTEWPRIREVGGGRFLFDFPSMFYDFPGGFRPGKTAGFRPIATHLRMVPDFCDWNGRLIVASDDTSVMGNPLGGQPQSNLWFGSVAEMAKWGRPAGWGGPWVGDAVKGGVPSDPYLFDGFGKRVLHLSHRAPTEVSFTIELDVKGDGVWTKHHTLRVPASGYTWHVFPTDLAAVWVRLTADRDCLASAYFHYSPFSQSRPATTDTGLFAALPAAGDKAPRTDGLLLPHADRLWFLAEPVGADGRPGEPRLCVVDQDVAIRHAPDTPAASEARDLLTKLKSHAYGFAFREDAASAIVEAKRGGKSFIYRIPKGHRALEDAPWSRIIREVVTERYLMNLAGTFYEVPREDFAGVRPVSTHNRWICDFCTWRGLLVLSGALAAAKPDGHYFASPDGLGLWFGAVDDLWQLGRPQGQGGPWLRTPVKAGQPSDPYLMTGFDKKTLELSHDAAAEVAFTVEVDFLAKGVWRPYQVFVVPPGKTLRHEFPDGYSAHWLRLTAGADCAATAWLTYE